MTVRTPRLFLKRKEGQCIVFEINLAMLAEVLEQAFETGTSPERIRITVTAKDLSRGRVSLIVDAPRWIDILRGELLPPEY